MSKNRYKQAKKVFSISLGPSGRRFEPCHSDHKSTVILIELWWAFSIPENRLKSDFSAVQAHKQTPLQAILRQGFARFTVVSAV